MTIKSTVSPNLLLGVQLQFVLTFSTRWRWMVIVRCGPF